MGTVEYLEGLMAGYKTDALVGVSVPEFQKHILSLPGTMSPEREGYIDAEKQRDQSVKFQWGHTHDFGSFQIPGLMRDRHINIMAKFIDGYGLPRDLTGKRVLEIGCWTGGMTLLLAAMGANVTALEEVGKYADEAAYLAKSFGLQGRVRVLPMSLYGIPEMNFDEFDYVINSGVLYHITDPVLALRICYNALKDKGELFIETAVDERLEGMSCRYGGPTRAIHGSKENRTREGWNWLVPTREALFQMLLDVGFMMVEMKAAPGSRAYSVATKGEHCDMLRAGLSKAVR